MWFTELSLPATKLSRLLSEWQIRKQRELLQGKEISLTGAHNSELIHESLRSTLAATSQANFRCAYLWVNIYATTVNIVKTFKVKCLILSAIHLHRCFFYSVCDFQTNSNEMTLSVVCCEWQMIVNINCQSCGKADMAVSCCTNWVQVSQHEKQKQVTNRSWLHSPRIARSYKARALYEANILNFRLNNSIYSSLLICCSENVSSSSVFFSRSKNANNFIASSCFLWMSLDKSFNFQ